MKTCTRGWDLGYTKLLQDSQKGLTNKYPRNLNIDICFPDLGTKKKRMEYEKNEFDPTRHFSPYCLTHQDFWRPAPYLSTDPSSHDHPKILLL